MSHILRLLRSRTVQTLENDALNSGRMLVCARRMSLLPSSMSQGSSEPANMLSVQPTQPISRMTIPPSEDPLLNYLTSHIMRHGERQKASRLVSKMLAEIRKLSNAPALPIFRQAIALASPSVRMRSHKKNAKASLIPTPLNERQRTFFAIKWLLGVSKNRNEKKLEERLAKEVIRIIDGESEVLRKKNEVHKLAVANRSNATFKPGRA